MKKIFLFLLTGIFYACSEQEPKIEKMKAQPFNVTATLAQNGKDVQLVWTSVKSSGTITYSVKYGDKEISGIRDTVYTLIDLPYYSLVEGYVIATNTLGESLRADFNKIITDADPKDPGFLIYVDPAFENLLVNYGIDKKSDGRLYARDTKNITELEIPDGDININVISAFSDLEVLKTGRLANITLDLSENLNLRELDLTGAEKLTGVTLPRTEKLQTLKIRGYAWSPGILSSIDLSANKNLRHIDLSYNTLESVDLSANGMLEFLNITGNKINEADLTNKKHLKTLYLAENHISEADLSGAPVLEDLNISSNRLSEVNLPVNSTLKTLNLDQNPVKKLRNLPVVLQNLSISHTKLFDFDFSTIPYIEALSIEGLQLEKIDLSKHTKLFSLNISNNALTQLSLCHSSNLKGVLRCENNNLTEVWLAPGLKSGELWGTDKEVTFRNCEK